MSAGPTTSRGGSTQHNTGKGARTTRGRIWVLLHSRAVARQARGHEPRVALEARPRVPQKAGAGDKARTRPMSVFTEPKIDCHAHVFDPIPFPLWPEYRLLAFRPGDRHAAQLRQIMKTYGVSHALLVQPNSGYGSDNSCMLDTIAQRRGPLQRRRHHRLRRRCRVPCATLKAQGIVGAAFNPTFHGIDYYKNSAGFDCPACRARDVPANSERARPVARCSCPGSKRCRSRVLIDHCGRPMPRTKVSTSPAFRSLLRLARTGPRERQTVGLFRNSRAGLLRSKTTWPFVGALVEAFTLDHCLWASDWPFLRAP